MLSSLLLNAGFGLATALALLIGVLGLTVRILLLLAGLLAAALLLAGLLSRVLILLARGLVRIGHSAISLVEPFNVEITSNWGDGFGNHSIPA